MHASEGACIESVEGIRFEAVSFFQSLLGSVDSLVCCPSIHELASLMDKSLTPEQALDLSTTVTVKEIRWLFFQWKVARARGRIDLLHFFKDSWSVVGVDLVRAVQYFFTTSRL